MLRRPNRSIEVFDISLMAVVTKAMGAFLVIMVLLMPYYSSGPIGEQNAADLAKTIADAQKQLDLAVQKLGQAKPSPDEIAKLLDEALRRLREAQELMARLKRDNDALNAQVKRLEKNLDDAKDELAQAEAELKKREALIVAVQLNNSDCADMRMTIALLTRDTYYSVKTSDSKNRPAAKDERRGIEEKDGETRYKYFFNRPGLSLGQVLTRTDEEIVTQIYNGKADVRPGQGYRFNSAALSYRVEAEGPYLLLVLYQDKSLKKIEGADGYALKKSNKPCNVRLTMQSYDPHTNGFYSFAPREFPISAGVYADIMYELELTTDQEGTRNFTRKTPSDQSVAWLKDQVAHAEKIDDVASAPPVKDATDSAKLSKKDALAAVDGMRVPEDARRCVLMLAQVTRMETMLQVLSPESQNALAAVHADCNQGRFADALSKAKAEMHRALK